MSYHVPMDFSSGRGVIINTSSKEEGLLKLPGNEPRFVNFFPYTPNLDQKRLALEPYYYDNITKSDAEKMLKSKNIEGCFLLRRALTRNNCVTLSYLFEKRVYHRILKAVPYCEPVTDTKITLVTLDYDTAFYNIKNLVDYYKLNKGRKLMCILSISLDDQVKLDKIKDKKSQEIPCPVEQESNAYVFPLDKTPRRLVRFYPVSRSTKPVKINGKMYYPLEELTDEQKAALKKAKESKAKSKNLLNFFRRDKPQTTTIPEIFQPSSSQSIELAGPSTSSQSSGPSTVAGPSTSSQPLGPSKLQQGPSEP
ncbi:hypothetical protein ABEB36_003629 [Hypothenemus hampei]|uniref:SH2 domain-containing protein n=1 Tax=Hypothenemus hampei TaxID=57062 RepID=A0ABD1F9T0_HYPHA